MNCHRVQQYSDAYVDGEIDPPTQLEFEQHLDQCESCLDKIAFLRAIKSKVREEVRATPAPNGLRARVLASLDEVDSQETRSAGVFGSFPVGVRVAVPLGLAATTLLVMAYSFGPALGDYTIAAMDPASPVLDDIVRVHSAELPADVPGSDPQQVVRYFRNRVRFPVRPAEFEGRDARLVGARLSNVRDRSAAALYYDVGGRRLTMVVFDGDDESLLEGSRRARLRGRDLRYRQVRGYTVPVRNQDGIHYAFTGDMDRQSLLQLAAAARVQY